MENTENIQQETKVEEKVYTEAEFNAKANEIASNRANRREARVRGEYEKRYGDFLGVLMAGTGSTTPDEAMEKTMQFYKEKGVAVDPKPMYTESDTKVLANADAAEIIRGGYEEVVEEVDRLAAMGDKMSPRDKAKFMILAENRATTERINALSQHGADPEIYGADEFKSFAAKFNTSVPITEVYDLYNQKNTKNIKPMGSLQHTAGQEGVIKDFYTPEEAKKIKPEDYKKYPGLWEKVRESMTRWKK